MKQFLLMCLPWLLVTTPLGWGVWKTVQKSWKLFQTDQPQASSDNRTESRGNLR